MKIFQILMREITLRNNSSKNLLSGLCLFLTGYKVFLLFIKDFPNSQLQENVLLSVYCSGVLCPKERKSVHKNAAGEFSDI